MLALVVSFTTAAAAARPSECASPTEYRALSARTLQTQLVVAALACGYKQEYNAIITTFRPTFASLGAPLRAYFDRQFRARGEARLNQFITELANQESVRSNRDRHGYCAASASLFVEMSAIKAAEFNQLLTADTLGRHHHVALCAPPRIVPPARVMASATR